jgi:hypothetical protein
MKLHLRKEQVMERSSAKKFVSPTGKEKKVLMGSGNLMAIAPKAMKGRAITYKKIRMVLTTL